MPERRPTVVDVLGFDGCIGAELFAVADMLGMANALVLQGRVAQPQPFQVSIVSPDGRSVRTSAGTTISARRPSRDVDILVVPGFYFAAADELLDRLGQYGDVTRHIRSRARLNKRIASICVGAFLLAEAGVLKGRTATTAWIVGALFARRYPDTQLELDQLLVRDGKFCTTGAVTAAYDLALQLVRERCGAATAALLGKIALIGQSRELQSPYVLADVGRPPNDLVARACHAIRRSLDQRFDLAALASSCRTSTRTLGRRFRADLGCSPLQFAHKVRVERAKSLLETTRMRVQDIPARLGYVDETTFRTIFTRHTGLTPASYRQQFGRISVRERT